MNVNGKDTYYASSDCSGSPTGTDTGAAQAKYVGTKLVGTETATKWDLVSTGDSTASKNIFMISNGKLRVGIVASDGGAVDAEGYPSTWDSTLLSKQ